MFALIFTLIVSLVLLMGAIWFLGWLGGLLVERDLHD